MRFPVDPRAPRTPVGADLPITPELLSQLLLLPFDTKIVGARYDPALRYVVLSVSHPDIRSATVIPRYRQSWSDARVSFERWGDAGDVAQVSLVD
jgi:hypothetical protein